MADRVAESDGLEALEAALLVRRVASLQTTVERERSGRRREQDARRRERKALLEMVIGLIERRDSSTGGHCRRVTSIASRICREMDYVPDESTTWGFLLHDVGKVLVRDAVLMKDGPLCPEEWIQMRRHPEEGAQLLRPAGFLDRAVPIVLHHHERWDGSGYPLGMRREEIPLPARAFAIADAFDAMTEDRPYRKARSVAQAVETIANGREAQFDPRCVDAFLATVGRADFGSLVQIPRPEVPSFPDE